MNIGNAIETITVFIVDSVNCGTTVDRHPAIAKKIKPNNEVNKTI